MELESWRLEFQWVLVHEDEQIHRQKEKTKEENTEKKKKEEDHLFAKDQIVHQHQITSNRSSSVLALFFVSSSTQSLKIRSSTSTRLPTQIALFFFLLLQLDRLLRLCVLQVLFFFKSDKNRVCKTRFWFLELESYKLEIYVAKLVDGGSRTRV